MEWLFENIAGAVVAGSVGTAMGSVGTLGIQWIRRRVEQRHLYRDVKTAYMKLRLVCEPETIDPARPGRQEFMRPDARDTANDLIMPLRRAGFDPPPKCRLDENSMLEWFKFLDDARIKLN